MATKTCIACGGTWPLSFFYIRYKGRKQGRCIGCNPRRTGPRYLLVRKAHNSIARHARSFGMTKELFSSTFAWNPRHMADDLTNLQVCPYCRNPVDDPKTLTFDVIDPTKPPHYASNVRICCLECNSAKHSMSPEAWAERIDCWNKYREWIEKIKSNPTIQLPLFQ